MGMDPISGMMQGAGSYFGAEAQANAAKNTANLARSTAVEQLGEQGREFDVTSRFQTETSQARQAAYAAAKKQGMTDQQAAEATLNMPNKALDTMTSDIKGQTAEELNLGRNQMAANLATQGVRGGQAALLLNRGAGEMATTAQRDVNKLKFADEADRRAYQMAKAARGQNAALAGSSF